MKRLYYGWVMVALGFIGLTVSSIPNFSFGVFVKPITGEFHWDRGALSLASSLTALLGGALGLITGRLTDKYGPRLPVAAGGLATAAGFYLMPRISSLWQVYLIWGILFGVGTSTSNVPIMSNISRWFTQRRGLAIGIASTGFTVGGAVAPILAQSLVSSYNWRQAYIILSIITFAVTLSIAPFMKQSPRKTDLKPAEEKIGDVKKQYSSVTEGLDFKQAMRTGRFWILGTTLFLFGVLNRSIVYHLAPYATDIGISVMVAAGLVSAISAVSTVGKLGFGFIVDRIGVKKVLSASLVLLTLPIVCLTLGGGTWTLYLFATIFGLGNGGLVMVNNSAAAELFGIKSVGTILASLFLFTQLGLAIGAPLTGFTYDFTGSYRLAFFVLILLGSLAFILSLILFRQKQLPVTAKTNGLVTAKE